MATSLFTSVLENSPMMNDGAEKTIQIIRSRAFFAKGTIASPRSTVCESSTLFLSLSLSHSHTHTHHLTHTVCGYVVLHATHGRTLRDCGLLKPRQLPFCRKRDLTRATFFLFLSVFFIYSLIRMWKWTVRLHTLYTCTHVHAPPHILIFIQALSARTLMQGLQCSIRLKRRKNEWKKDSERTTKEKKAWSRPWCRQLESSALFLSKLAKPAI